MAKILPLQTTQLQIVVRQFLANKHSIAENPKQKSWSHPKVCDKVQTKNELEKNDFEKKYIKASLVPFGRDSLGEWPQNCLASKTLRKSFYGGACNKGIWLLRLKLLR